MWKSIPSVIYGNKCPPVMVLSLSLVRHMEIYLQCYKWISVPKCNGLKSISLLMPRHHYKKFTFIHTHKLCSFLTQIFLKYLDLHNMFNARQHIHLAFLTQRKLSSTSFNEIVYLTDEVLTKFYEKLH